MKSSKCPQTDQREPLRHSLSLSILLSFSVLGLAGCRSNAFLNLDPWAESIQEQPSDAWMSGGRYDGKAIVSSDPPPYVEEQALPGNGGNLAQSETPAMGGLEAAPRAKEPLLAWDGDVIDGPKRGEVVERENMSQGLNPSPGGRTYLLQLYQEVLDERDLLADEVRALRKGLGDAQARLDDTTASTSGFASRLDMLQKEVDRLAKENEDLAGRLATVQIRRLEAEKMLLEARIDWYRSQESGALAPAADMGSASSKPVMGNDMLNEMPQSNQRPEIQGW